jgi:hypothetical protein
MRHAPVLTVLLLFAVLMAILVGLALERTGGRLAYALDDAYIHLALARSLATAGDWGLSPGHFDNIASSPLWVLILAVGRFLLGDRLWLPLALNLLIAALLLVTADRFLARRHAGVGGRSFALILLIFLTPLPALVVSGMEHLLQTWLALICFSALLRVIVRGRPLGTGTALLAALMVSVRFEGLFLVAPALLLLWRDRRRGAVLGLLAAAIAPVLITGIIAASQGGSWLPESILLKANGLDFRSGGDWFRSLMHPLLMLLRNPLSPYSLHMILLIIGGAVLWRRREGLGLETEASAGLCLLLPAMLLQIFFGGLGWFFRYEAWLVALALLLGATLPWRSLMKRPLPALILITVLVALAARGGVALVRVPGAVANIHGQQVQMGEFLAEYHAGETVVANDVGAISYYAGVRCIDLFGLADPLLARAKREGGATPALLDSLARSRGARVAVLYPEIFAERLPAHWVELATWTIPDNVVCARPTVAWYACDSTRTRELTAELATWSRRLPSGVIVESSPLDR